jgi:hypothetical protein
MLWMLSDSELPYPQTSPASAGFLFSVARCRGDCRAERPTMKFILSNRNQLTNRRVVFGLGTRTPSQRRLPAPLCLPNPHGGAFLFRNAKLAAPHSITSSAMASSPGGIVRPSALAVLRLITNSNLVDWMTGRSAGFSPLRILPVYTPAWRYAPVMLVP